MKPSAPALQTAATRSGVSPPPANGAWIIGCVRPKRRVSLLFAGMLYPQGAALSGRRQRSRYRGHYCAGPILPGLCGERGLSWRPFES